MHSTTYRYYEQIWMQLKKDALAVFRAQSFVYELNPPVLCTNKMFKYS